MKKLSILLVSLFFLFSCFNEGNEKKLVEGCNQNGGNWLAEFEECEYIDSEWCDDNGGKFNGCTSACRNDPEPGDCILSCVSLCNF